MSHTYAHNPVHVVFSTKDRRKLIPKENQHRRSDVVRTRTHGVAVGYLVVAPSGAWAEGQS